MPQSKYGGIPVEEEKPKPGGSKYGGIPVEDEAPAAQAAPPTVPSNKLEEAISPTGGPDNFWTSPHGLIRTGLRGLVHGARELMTPGARTEGAADVLEGAGRVIAPAAIGATLPALITNPLTTGAGLIGGGLIGKGAQKGAEKVTDYFGGSPEAARLAGDVAPLVAGPFLSKTAGRLIQSPAKPFVRSALGLKGSEEAFGGDQAREILRNTRGFRPEAIARSGNARIAQFSRALDTAASDAEAAGFPKPSLTPARKVIDNASGRAEGFNSQRTPAEVRPISDFLEKARPGFGGDTHFAPGTQQPITYNLTGPANAQGVQVVPGKAPTPLVSAEQPHGQFLGMKRQFNDDFVRNWNPNTMSKGRLGIARRAYGAMANEFNQKTPGASVINEQLEGLIPAVDRAEAVSRNAGTLQRAMDRISRPTGALVPALIGKEIGGTPGLLGGLGVPEMISDPATKMFTARGLYRGGRSLLLPAAQRASRIAPLVTR